MLQDSIFDVTVLRLSTILLWLAFLSGGFFGRYVAAKYDELERIPFAIKCALAFIGITAVNGLVGISFPTAVIRNCVWLLVGIELVAQFAFGYFLWQIGAARSRDASSGHRWSFLLFVPFWPVQLGALGYLLFKPSDGLEWNDSKYVA